MAETLEAVAQERKPCSVEIFRRGVPGDVKIWYWVAERRANDDVPYPDPVDIIDWNERYFIIVYVVLSDQVRRHFCGSLCVDIDVDTCGPAPDIQFNEQDVVLDPCGDGRYLIVFELPPGTFTQDRPRCGRVYKICVTVGSKDPCGNAGLIWGHCDSLEVAVHPPVANP
jgi:hypothetical protein